MARKTGEVVKPLIAIDDSGCWLWLGKVSKRTGYGCKQYAGRTVLAHRWVYQWFHGWIPKHLVLDHTCRNRKCVNPAHLQPTSQAENCRRGMATKLTEDQVRELKKMIKEMKWGERKAVAAKFGISPMEVSSIKHGYAWADIN